jgi:hypothetical protein
LLTVSKSFMNVANSVLWRMASILTANKVNLFVSSGLFGFWYHSPNFLDTPRVYIYVCVCACVCVCVCTPKTGTGNRSGISSGYLTFEHGYMYVYIYIYICVCVWVWVYVCVLARALVCQWVFL